MARLDQLRRELLSGGVPPGPRDLAMLRHQRAEPVDIDRLAPLLGELLRQLDRKAEGRRQPERLVGVDRRVAGERIELPEPALERLGEARLLVSHHALDLSRMLLQRGVGVAHLLDHDGGHPVDTIEADALRLLDRAPEQPPADVAAPFVRGHDAFRHQERHRAEMVREHTMRTLRDLAVAVADTGLLGDPVHDHPEAVRVEDRVDALDDAHRALEAETGVDVSRRQPLQNVPGPQVELHEHEVVDLHVAIAVARPAHGVAAGVALAAVVEDLRALPARAGLGRLPEVVLAQPHDPVGRDPDALPRRDRDRILVECEHRVALVHGRPETVCLEPHHLRDELPRIVDRLVLEVVAEREVSEHLEERAVTFRPADVVEVRVLAACAEARLDAHDPVTWRLPGAEEVRLERLHPGDDEERRGVVVGWDQRVRRHTQMPAFLVERLEALAQLRRRRRHGEQCTERSATRPRRFGAPSARPCRSPPGSS